MSVRKVLEVPNPLLKRKSRPVGSFDKRVLGVVKDLNEILRAQKNPQGVGLAAPQIGRPWRIFVLKIGGQIEVFINPVIVSSSKKLNVDVIPAEELTLEGCLSIPKIFGLVKRPYRTTLRYQNEKGQKRQKSFEGPLSTQIQHETDHLDGILFTERVLKQGGRLFEEAGGELKEMRI